MPRLFQVRSSKIHGKGVFATRRIPKGTRLIEYRGERISWEEADRRYDDDIQPHHTFLFAVDDETVIDGGRRGNDARWINHSCDPNCEAVDEDGRIFIETIRDIERGEELTYDYSYILDEPHTAKVKARYPCRCGSPRCRGTILGNKRRFREQLAREERRAKAEQRRAKKSSAKKSSARKSSTKTAGAKKTGARKTGTKRAGAKKTSARKTGTKKTTAKKTGASKRRATKTGTKRGGTKTGAKRSVTKKRATKATAGGRRR